MEQKINTIKANGFKLDFDNVFEKAFENYKKIAIYAGLTFLVFGAIFFILLVAGFFCLVDIQNFNRNTIRIWEIKMETAEFIFYRYIVFVFLSILLCPIGASFLKMAACADKDEAFGIRNFLDFYQWSYFKELFLATAIIALFSLGIESIFTLYKIPFIGGFISLLISLFTILTVPLIIFEKLKAFPALTTSINLTRKSIFVLALLLIVSFFCSLVGLIALLIGVVFTIPFSISMQYAIYKTIIGFDSSETAVIEVD